MIRISRSKEDIQILEEIDKLGVISSKLKGFDFSDTAVIKPWGYEYLVYENEDKTLCAWVLHLENNSSSTSMHCHRNKKTRIVVLNGSILLQTLQKELRLSERGEALIDKATFHSIRALSNGCIITEIESPSFKPDAVRWKDKWGRELKEYESKCKLIKTHRLPCPYRTDSSAYQEIVRLAKETGYIFNC